MFAGPYTQNCACRVVIVETSGTRITGLSGCTAHGNRNLLTQTVVIESP
jgi:hypothetical protein